MDKFVILFRGINVGGKNLIPMKALKQMLEEAGFSDVVTYIQSGNVIVASELSSQAIASKIEKLLPQKFKLDTSLIKVLVLSQSQLKEVVELKPEGFGEQPGKYHSDVIFLIDVEVDAAMAIMDPREGVDQVWPGKRVVYFQRLSAERTKSKLSKIISTPMYKSFTIRNWNTVTKLLDLISKN